MSKNKDSIFLSPNNEHKAKISDEVNHLCVREVVEKSKLDFTLMFRHPYWIRNGYVEEAFAIRLLT